MCYRSIKQDNLSLSVDRMVLTNCRHGDGRVGNSSLIPKAGTKESEEVRCMSSYCYEGVNGGGERKKRKRWCRSG